MRRRYIRILDTRRTVQNIGIILCPAHIATRAVGRPIFLPTVARRLLSDRDSAAVSDASSARVCAHTFRHPSFTGSPRGSVHHTLPCVQLVGGLGSVFFDHNVDVFVHL